MIRPRVVVPFTPATVSVDPAAYEWLMLWRRMTPSQRAAHLRLAQCAARATRHQSPVRYTGDRTGFLIRETLIHQRRCSFSSGSSPAK